MVESTKKDDGDDCSKILIFHLPLSAGKQLHPLIKALQIKEGD